MGGWEVTAANHPLSRHGERYHRVGGSSMGLVGGRCEQRHGNRVGQSTVTRPPECFPGNKVQTIQCDHVRWPESLSPAPQSPVGRCVTHWPAHTTSSRMPVLSLATAFIPVCLQGTGCIGSSHQGVRDKVSPVRMTRETKCNQHPSWDRR